MEELFKQLFKNEPPKEENGIYYFGDENDGDCFRQSDIVSWQNGAFSQNWRTRKLLENAASRHLADEIIANNEYIVDLACGPGMGFIPTIKQLSPSFRCLATDANPFVLNEWKQYLQNNENDSRIDFAQFSAFNLPFKNNTVLAYSSFIGLSSTREGNRGYDSALSEIYRTLADGGSCYAIENEWNDIPAILNLFDKINRQPWSVFCEKQTSWHDRFVNSGFDILYEKPFEYRSLRPDDNELGEAAAEFGVEIGISFTAYIVRKRNG